MRNGCSVSRLRSRAQVRRAMSDCQGCASSQGGPNRGIGFAGVVEMVLAGSDTVIQRIEARQRPTTAGASGPELVEDAL